MGRKKKKREKPSGPKGAPEWVVTFTDMISLLVTFFVLLMTFSSLDHYDALQVASFLKGKTGVHRRPPADSAAEMGEEDLIAGSTMLAGSSTPHSRPPEELPEDIEEMGKERSEQHQELDLARVADGIVLEFGEEECFATGSDEVNGFLRRTLEEVGGVLEHYPHVVVVEGYTDGAFHPSTLHGTPLQLSLARARNAARVLLSESQVRPEQIQIVGHGASRPRADNESPGGRRLNRRIQVRVMALSTARANHFEALRGQKERG